MEYLPKKARPKMTGQFEQEEEDTIP